MNTLLWIAGGVAWLGCGLVTVALDISDYPKPVVPGLDQAFRVFMVLMGPFGLAMEIVIREDMKRW